MARSRRKPEGAGAVPVDSFSDIAFLLIIFFILTTTLNATRGFTSELPQGKKAEARSQAKTPTVTVKDAQILWNGDPVDLAGLEAKLRPLELASKEGEERIVLFEAVGDVPYRDYYAAMAAIDRAGGHVAIVKEEK